MKAENKNKTIIVSIVLIVVLIMIFIITKVILKNSSKDKIENLDNQEIVETLEKTSKKNIYGDFVNYSIDLNENGKTTDDWKIFYKDDERVYLISADYILNESKYLNLSGTRNDY